jgi:hypothetical protein
VIDCRQQKRVDEAFCEISARGASNIPELPEPGNSGYGGDKTDCTCPRGCTIYRVARPPKKKQQDFI